MYYLENNNKNKVCAYSTILKIFLTCGRVNLKIQKTQIYSADHITGARKCPKGNGKSLKGFRKENKAGRRWLTPVILATQETGWFEASLGK
jgi:hypothetical protein